MLQQAEARPLQVQMRLWAPQFPAEPNTHLKVEQPAAELPADAMRKNVKLTFPEDQRSRMRWQVMIGAGEGNSAPQ
ncbi:hypothetical protein HK23_10435 [Acetobacter malorum]|uniref:Uncharacterized protein n=1 Tax=Acetobacter malorum TaxID=178901 RepID=A0A1Y3G2Q1_9PROT|nr:hypothetical protein HK23_10435 [Acetobacter malorum]